jgi:hypothetical protein
MLDDYELDLNIRQALLSLMMTLYSQGITEIHMGGVMRLLGVSNETACKHDNERLILDDNFVKYVEEITKPRPAGQTLH